MPTRHSERPSPGRSGRHEPAMRQQAPVDFAARWLAFVSDPAFLQMSRSAELPSLFRIVGREHFERWHSAFLGWLLDPSGSHLTRQYPLSRLLIAAQRAASRGGSAAVQIERLAFAKVLEAAVFPNEFAPAERGVNGVGRFDVFVAGTCEPLGDTTRRFNVLIEMKIDSPNDRDQMSRYASWLDSAHADDINVAVFLSRDANGSRAIDPAARWAHLSFQDLHDLVLVPTAEHPAINPLARTLVAEYVKNLRHTSRGTRMALTFEQRQIALGLYERHAAAFDELIEVLIDEGVIVTPNSKIRAVEGRAKGRIAVRIGGVLLEERTLAALFRSALTHLVANHWLDKLPLPWGDTATRYLVSNQSPAEHPNGRSFFYPVEHGGYIMESHFSRERGLKALAALCAALDLTFEEVPTR